MVERMKHLPTTAAGVAITGILFTVLGSMGCHIPDNPTAWVVSLLPTILGLLSK